MTSAFHYELSAKRECSRRIHLYVHTCVNIDVYMHANSYAYTYEIETYILKLYIYAHTHESYCSMRVHCSYEIETYIVRILKLKRILYVY